MRWWGGAGLRALWWGLLGLTLASGCAAARPSRPGDLCSIFEERPDWYEDARDSYRRWGVPVPLQLAVISHESGFDSDARPPRHWYLGFIPGPRPSTAYGYGQVVDGTWDWYRGSTGESFADRDDFGDVTDFLGWYGTVGQRRHGIRKDDPYSFYLSYLLGHAGYDRERRRQGPADRAARDVAAQTDRYASQYQSCRVRLDEEIDATWWPF